MSEKIPNNISDGIINYKCKNGQLFRGKVRCKTIGDADGTEYVWVSVSNLSKEAELENDLIRKNKELEKFAYTAAHDLQSPLKLISASLQILQQNLGNLLDEESRQLMEYTVESACRMRVLIKDLLDYTKLGHQATAIEEVDMNVLLQDVLKFSGMSIWNQKLILSFMIYQPFVETIPHFFI